MCLGGTFINGQRLRLGGVWPISYKAAPGLSVHHAAPVLSPSCLVPAPVRPALQGPQSSHIWLTLRPQQIYSSFPRAPTPTRCDRTWSLFHPTFELNGSPPGGSRSSAGATGHYRTTNGFTANVAAHLPQPEGPSHSPRDTTRTFFHPPLLL